MIKSRHVYHIAGYDPIGAASQHRRFKRQVEIFQHTWNVAASTSDLSQSDDGTSAWWSVTTQAADWQVQTVHEVLLWDDIVSGDSRRSLLARLGKGALAYLDIIISGTMVRYFRANVRYALYFVFPIFQFLVFVAAGWLCADAVMALLGLSGGAAAAAGLLVGFAVFFGLMQWPGRRWGMHQLLDDWIFAREYRFGWRHDVDSRLDRFADILIARARSTAADEIVVVGHSLGAMLAIDVLMRALARDPDFSRRGPAVCLLTIGATIPKFALHPAAETIRRLIGRLVAEPSIAWAECQARDDAISFYKFDPASLKRLTGDRLDGKPSIRRVQLHEMLQPQTLARYRHSILRLHYQWVMANDKRASYDYYLMVCGPVPFCRWTRCAAGFLDLMTAEGAYRDAVPHPDMVVEQAS